MSKVVFIVLALLLCTVAAFADSDAIAKRKKILKAVGESTRPVASMMKGNAPFDLTVVRTTLAKYAASAALLPPLFPDDSKTGGETEAKAAIWDDKPKFEGLFKKLADDSTAASTTIVDDASFRTTMPKVLAVCKSCHDSFREKK